MDKLAKKYQGVMTNVEPWYFEDHILPDLDKTLMPMRSSASSAVKLMSLSIPVIFLDIFIIILSRSLLVLNASSGYTNRGSLSSIPIRQPPFLAKDKGTQTYKLSRFYGSIFKSQPKRLFPSG